MIRGNSDNIFNKAVNKNSIIYSYFFFILNKKFDIRYYRVTVSVNGLIHLFYKSIMDHIMLNIRFSFLHTSKIVIVRQQISTFYKTSVLCYCGIARDDFFIGVSVALLCFYCDGSVWVRFHKVYYIIAFKESIVKRKCLLMKHSRVLLYQNIILYLIKTNDEDNFFYLMYLYKA